MTAAAVGHDVGHLAASCHALVERRIDFRGEVECIALLVVMLAHESVIRLGHDHIMASSGRYYVGRPWARRTRRERSPITSQQACVDTRISPSPFEQSEQYSRSLHESTRL